MFIEGALILGGYLLWRAKHPTVQSTPSGLTILEASKQQVESLNAQGVPVTVITPTAAGVTPVQSGTVPNTSRPAPKSQRTGRPKIIPQPSSKGTVYGPAKVIQPDKGGDSQPVPHVKTPTGIAPVVMAGVKDAQAALNALGAKPRLKEDGKLGPKTVQAIKDFQRKVGLGIDGSAGAATLTALANAVASLAQTHPTPAESVVVAQSNKPGMSKVAIQKALNAKGANPKLKEDGVFGPKSVAAVKAFQLSRGLVADGVAGPATQAALVS